jgi:hypothetical protein
MRRILLLASAVCLLSCDNATKPIVMAGSWSGTSPDFAMTLAITESKEHVAGTGTATNVDGSAPVTVDGTFINPDFSFRVLSDGYQPFVFSGKLSGNTISGTLDGSGFSQYAFTMTR